MAEAAKVHNVSYALVSKKSDNYVLTSNRRTVYFAEGCRLWQTYSENQKAYLVTRRAQKKCYGSAV